MLKSFIFIFFLTCAFGCQDYQNEIKNPHKNEVDIGLSALALAKEIYPEINVDNLNDQLNFLVKKVQHVVQGSTSPEFRIRVLNSVIFQQERFFADPKNSRARKTDLYFLNKVLETKEGNCFSLPLLYVALGQRLGWPLYPVHVPDHCFVRYEDNNLKEKNIEATSGGGFIPDEVYAREFKASAQGVKSGTYLRSMTYSEFLGELEAKTAVAISRQGRLEEAIQRLERAVELNPRLVGAWANLAKAFRMRAQATPKAESKAFVRKAEACEKRLDELGFVSPEEVPWKIASSR